MQAKYDDNYSNSHSIIYYSENKKKKRRTIKRVLSIAVVLMMVLVGVIVAYSAGFIPVTALLETKEPIGNVKEMGIGVFARFYPKLSDNPVLDKFKYGIYGTDEPFSVVIKDYDQRLSDEGYSFQYQKVERINGLKVRSYGYVKGFTGVGIVVISNTRLVFGHKTTVLYSTGNVFDYKGIVDEYGGISGLLA